MLPPTYTHTHTWQYCEIKAYTISVPETTWASWSISLKYQSPTSVKKSIMAYKISSSQIYHFKYKLDFHLQKMVKVIDTASEYTTCAPHSLLGLGRLITLV